MGNARIRVEAVGNIFFDISAAFRITERNDFVNPTAVATAPDITMPGGIAQQMQVTYEDDNFIEVADLDNNDIEVIGPDGSSYMVFLITLPPPVDLPIVTMTYQISAGWGLGCRR